MAQEVMSPGASQADFIKEELNFDVDPKDPLTKAHLEDHPQDEWLDILGNNELRKKVVKPGQPGTRPQRPDICVISFTGKLEDGTVVEEEHEMTIHLGDMDVIQGIDLSVALMDTGEVAELKISSRFAYGSLGREPDIPPDATLHYTIELNSIKQQDDIDSMSLSQKKELGNKKRERGNWWIKRDEPVIAIQCYRRALSYLSPSDSKSTEEDNSEPISDADLQSLLEDKMKVYNNLALAQIKSEAYDAALESVENVLRCQPQNTKALFRKGKILHLKKEHSAAYSTLLQALKISPQDKTIQQELAILKRKSEKDAQSEKNLYRKMLGNTNNKTKNNNNNNNNVKDEAKNKTNMRVAWSIVGGTAVALIGLFAYRFIS